MCYFLAHTGLRINEALTLRWEQLDFERGCISIVGKGNKPRLAPLPLPVRQALLDWKADGWEGGSVWNNWTYNAARIAFNRLRPKLPFDVTFHSLRRSAATYWVEQLQTSITQVQVMLGHSDIKTTQLYVESDNMSAIQHVNQRFAS